MGLLFCKTAFYNLFTRGPPIPVSPAKPSLPGLPATPYKCNRAIKKHTDKTELKYTSLIKIIIKEENFKWHLEAFASELFK